MMIRESGRSSGNLMPPKGLRKSTSQRALRRCALAVAIAASAAAFLAEPVMAYAAQAQATLYNIPAGDLGYALTRLAQQGGVQLSYTPDLVVGKTTDGLHGLYAPAKALAVILRGSGIESKAAGATLFVLKPADPPPAAPLSPSASRARATTHGDPVQPTAPVKPETLQSVQVLGTRINSATLATTTHTIEVTPQDIQATGLTSIGDVLQQLPSMGSGVNTHENLAGNFGDGAGGGANGAGVGGGSIQLSLRNLDPERTLVLVDGLPWVNESSGSGVSGAVDLGTIPFSAVQSIQVLPSGASTLYGSSAIAGVVNIITKQQQSGGEARVYFGVHDIDGTHTGLTQQESLSFGGSGDKYNYFVTVDHTKEGFISSSVWPGASSACVPGTGLANCAPATPVGQITFTAPNGDTFGGLCPGGACQITPKEAVGKPGEAPPFPSGFKRVGPSDRYNYQTGGTLQMLNKRTGFMGSVTYDLAPSVQLYLRGTYSKKRTTNRDAPNEIAYGPTGSEPGDAAFTGGFSADNPFNPFGFGINENNSDPAFGILISPQDPGPRYFTQNARTDYLATGLTGSFGLGARNFHWDVNIVHGSNNASQFVVNHVNDSALVNALGPASACAQIQGCVPYNPFGGPGSMTPQMINYIFYNAASLSHQQLGLESANLSGDVIRLPADWLRFAMGFQHRQLSGSFTPNPLMALGIAHAATPPFSGSYSVNSFYVETNVPILAHVPGAYALNLDLASRYSNYSTFGGTTNSRAALRWQPVRSLTLRGTFGQGYRSPTIGELFGARTFEETTLVDPCDFNSPIANGAVISNCRALGVLNPDTFQQPNTELNVESGGNSALRPERSRNWDFGVVYSPAWASNQEWSRAADLKIDSYHISIKNVIAASDTQTLLNRCAQTLNQVFCSAIDRNGAGVITLVQDQLQNLGREDTSGFDIAIDWFGNPTKFGEGSAHFSATYVNAFTIKDGLTGLAEPETVGVETASSAIPRWKAQVRLDWKLGNWQAMWTNRFISQVTEDCESAAEFPICTDPTPTVEFPDGHRSLGAITYTDLRVDWTVPDAPVTLSGGVNNLFDRTPPACVSCELNGYDATTYDLPGRYFYVAADAKF